MNSSRAFFTGFSASLILFILANLLAAHLHSDCGLPAFFGQSMCADDIVRAGFPLIFYEEGGFAYRHNFNLLYLLVDVLIGFGFAWLCGVLLRRRAAKSAPNS